MILSFDLVTSYLCPKSMLRGKEEDRQVWYRTSRIAIGYLIIRIVDWLIGFDNPVDGL